jgi:hypothetical protein
MAVGANPFELPEEKGEPRAPLEGVVAEGQPAAGTRPTCPGCGGRVMLVVGVGGQLRWVCQLEGGTGTPCWIPDVLSSRSKGSVRFESPATSSSSTKPRGLRLEDVNVVRRAPKPAERPAAGYLDPPQQSSRPS